MREDRDEARDLTRAVVRIQAKVLAAVCGVMGGAAVFVMTAWLLIKGGPQVGPHLQLLGEFFYGYTVTWKGSLIGFLYGAAIGGAIGWGIGTVYDRIVELRCRE